MKTIQELNSKWYWRLIKVVYGLFIFLLISISGFILYNSNIWYNQAKLREAESVINEKSKVSGALEKMDLYSDWDKLKLSDIKVIWPNVDEYNYNIIGWYYVFAEDSWKKIDRVFVCWREVKIWCSSDPMVSYIENSINDIDWSSVIVISQDTYNNSKEFITFKMQIEDNAKNAIKKLINRETYIKNFNEFKESTWTDISEIIWERNYRWLYEIIRISIWIIWILIWILIFTLMFRWLIYYIILWKFNPEK